MNKFHLPICVWSLHGIGLSYFFSRLHYLRFVFEPEEKNTPFLHSWQHKHCMSNDGTERTRRRKKNWSTTNSPMKIRMCSDDGQHWEWMKGPFKRWGWLFHIYTYTFSATPLRFSTPLCAFSKNGKIYIEMRKFVLFNLATTNVPRCSVKMWMADRHHHHYRATRARLYKDTFKLHTAHGAHPAQRNTNKCKNSVI